MPPPPPRSDEMLRTMYVGSCPFARPNAGSNETGSRKSSTQPTTVFAGYDVENGPEAMTAGIEFADEKVMAELTAKMLLEVEAVRFMADKPFIFTSGWASPVYTDCRRLISFPSVRHTLTNFAAATILREAGFEQFDAVAGGGKAGSPVFPPVGGRGGPPPPRA